MVTEEQDRQAEEAHIQEALSRCGYPEWTMKRVKLDMEVQKEKAKKKKKPKPKSVDHKTSVAIPYVEGFRRLWPGCIKGMASPRP